MRKRLGLRIELRPYRLPLVRPWCSAAHAIRERRGWLVIASARGRSGFGDCAPLPESGTETTDQAGKRLATWQGRAAGSDCEGLLAALRRLWPSPAPSADCAVETALLDLLSRQRALSLRRMLDEDTRLPTRVAVNAALGRLDRHATEAAARAVSAGFRVLKVKVGMGPEREETEWLRTLAGILPPEARLRLDANRAWDAASAERTVARLAGLPIESIEEPLGIAHPRLLRQLQCGTSIALALDESLADLFRRVAVEDLPVRRLVLKPGVVGGLRPTLDLARRARACGKEVVLTGLVESAAGLWATAQLAAVVGGDLAHGLGTASWLARDLGTPPLPRRGYIVLPDGAGSGFAQADTSRVRMV